METASDQLGSERAAGVLASAGAWLAGSGEQLLVLTSPDSVGANTAAALLAAEAAAGRPAAGAMIHAQGSAAGGGARTLAWILAAQLGYCVSTPAELCRRLEVDERPVTLLISEYAEEGGGQASGGSLADLLLRPLLSVHRVRLVLACGSTVPDLGGVTGTVLSIAPSTAVGAGLLPSRADTAARFDEVGIVAACTTDPVGLSIAVERAWPDLDPLRRAQWDCFGQALTTVEPDPAQVVPLLATAALATGDTALLDHVRAQISVPGAEDSASIRYWPRWARWWRSPDVSSADAASWIGSVGALANAWGRGSDRGPADAVEPQGEEVLMAADSIGRLHCLDPANGAVLARLDSPTVRVSAMAALAAGRILLADPTGALELAGRSMQEDAHAPSIEDLLDPDHDQKSHDHAVLEGLSELAGGCAVTAIGAQADRFVAIGRADGFAALFDAVHRRPLATPAQLHFGRVTAIAVHADSAGVPAGALTLVSGGEDCRLIESTVADGRIAITREIASRPTSLLAVDVVASSNEGVLVAAGWSDGLVTLHERVEGLEWSPRGSWSLGWAPAGLCWAAGGSTLTIGGAYGLLAFDLNG